jgi:flagellar hook-associated protein 2
MASVGIQVDRTGHFVFDPGAFAAAYAKDPSTVTKMFDTANGGFASRVADVTKAASDSFEGTLTSAINGHNSSIKQLQDSISNWDLRLDMRRATLTAQFTAMETALSQMQSQASWLSSQISTLPSMSSNKGK